MFHIAIDGPGGAGKSSIAKAVAKRLDILYVDTGALYRTVGLFVKQNNTDPKNAEAVGALLPSLSIVVKYEGGAQVVYLNGVNYPHARDVYVRIRRLGDPRSQSIPARDAKGNRKAQQRDNGRP